MGANLGGQYYSTPIFNIADSCIFIGVCLILFFQRRFFGEHQMEDAMLPVSGPDATDATVLPAAEYFEEEKEKEEHVSEEGASRDDIKPQTDPESVLPDEQKTKE
ncbi:hypothetical protein [Spirosoma sp. KNUC1025]|uniref:hypothetical protein n=1 Tax=Spirosoma sp. KNUC1025 TaxID=2894082 RepID=UPI003863FFEE